MAKATTETGRNTPEFIRFLEPTSKQIEGLVRETLYQGMKEGFGSHEILAYLLSTLTIAHTSYIMRCDVANNRLDGWRDFPSFGSMEQAYREYVKIQNKVEK